MPAPHTRRLPGDLAPVNAGPRFFGSSSSESLPEKTGEATGTPDNGPEITPKEWSNRPKQWSDCPSNAQFVIPAGRVAGQAAERDHGSGRGAYSTAPSPPMRARPSLLFHLDLTPPKRLFALAMLWTARLRRIFQATSRSCLYCLAGRASWSSRIRVRWAGGDSGKRMCFSAKRSRVQVPSSYCLRRVSKGVAEMM